MFNGSKKKNEEVGGKLLTYKLEFIEDMVIN
jgi:hypothetical protein